MHACTHLNTPRQILDVSCNQLTGLPVSVSTLKSLQVSSKQLSLLQVTESIVNYKTSNGKVSVC